MDLRTGQWLNEPASYEVDADRLAEVDGDFRLEARLAGEFSAQYDQAGLMVLADEQEWVKAGIEHVDGRPWLSAVVTHGTSDWSRAALPDEALTGLMAAAPQGPGFRVELSDVRLAVR